MGCEEREVGFGEEEKGTARSLGSAHKITDVQFVLNEMNVYESIP